MALQLTFFTLMSMHTPEWLCAVVVGSTYSHLLKNHTGHSHPGMALCCCCWQYLQSSDEKPYRTYIADISIINVCCFGQLHKPKVIYRTGFQIQSEV